MTEYYASDGEGYVAPKVALPTFKKRKGIWAIGQAQKMHIISNFLKFPKTKSPCGRRTRFKTQYWIRSRRRSFRFGLQTRLSEIVGIPRSRKCGTLRRRAEIQLTCYFEL